MPPYRKGSMQFHAEVDKAVNETFKEQRKERRHIKNDATVGALRIWLSLPAEWQATIMNEPPEDVMKFLSAKLLESRILEKLEKVDPKELLDAIAKIATE